MIMLPPSLRCPAPRGMLIYFLLESAPDVMLIFPRIAWGTRVNGKDDAENPPSHQLLRYPSRPLSYPRYIPIWFIQKSFPNEFTKK